MRTVTLASGAVVTLGAYVRAWKQALAAPADARFRQGPADDFPDRDRTRADVLRQFRAGMHSRINQAVRYSMRNGYDAQAATIVQRRRWRKLQEPWQSQARRAARMVNTPRLIVRPPEVPRELRARLAHRLHTED